MPTITYNRDTSKDIIPPIQILVDSQGRVITYGGKALKIDSSASLTNPSVLIDSSDNVYTYNGNVILIEQASTATLSFTKDSTITSYTIDETTYTSNQSITLAEGNHTLSISQTNIYTGGLSINGNTMGLTQSCTFTISGTTVTFTDSTFTYSGTTSTTFALSYSGGGSIK